MEPLQKYSEISSAFSKFIKTGDQRLVEGYSRNDIELTILYFQKLKGSEHYKAMVNRIAELKDLEILSRKRKSKRKFKFIVSMLSILAAFILYFIILAVRKGLIH